MAACPEMGKATARVVTARGKFRGNADDAEVVPPGDSISHARR